MSVTELFSKRQKRLRGEVPEVYVYDKIPTELKVQIVQIIGDAIGKGKPYMNNYPEEAFKYIHKTLCREYGKFTLGHGNYNESNENCVLNFLLNTQDPEQAIDIIQLAFQFIDTFIRPKIKEYVNNSDIAADPDDAIEELNQRFKEHGVGYQFESGEIIRIDSTFIHSEITKPTLTLLWNRKFAGANDEYLKAHEHYRHGRNKECLTECLKALESTLKIICKEKGWQYNQTDTASVLIQICFQNNLVPSFTQNQFTSLKSLLESGVPTIRNRLGGHGQGQIPQEVDDEITRYGLNLTGTNIIYLIELSGLK